MYWRNYRTSLMVYTYISTIEIHVMVNQKFTNIYIYIYIYIYECLVWHDLLDDLYYTYINTIKMHLIVKPEVYKSE